MDGILAAAKLAALVDTNGPLSAQLDTFERYPLRRTSIETDDKQAVMTAVAADVSAEYADVAIQRLDGIRIDVDRGWMLIRASGTQPLVRVTAEGTTSTAADELLAEARGYVESAMSNI